MGGTYTSAYRRISKPGLAAGKNGFFLPLHAGNEGSVPLGDATPNTSGQRPPWLPGKAIPVGRKPDKVPGLSSGQCHAAHRAGFLKAIS